MLDINAVLGRRLVKYHVAVVFAVLLSRLRVYLTLALLSQIKFVSQNQERRGVRLVVLASAHEMVLPVG